jgi:hypothetical protein
MIHNLAIPMIGAKVLALLRFLQESLCYKAGLVSNNITSQLGSIG